MRRADAGAVAAHGMKKSLSKRLLVLAFSAIYSVALELSGRLAGSKSTKCIVLYYHGIPSEQRARFASQMDNLLRRCTPLRLVGLGQVPESKSYCVVTFDDGFSSVAQNAVPELVSRSIPAIIFVPTGCLGSTPSWADPDSISPGERVMSARELQELVRTNIIVLGSHGVHHRSFTSLSDKELKEELTESRRLLEALTGQPVRCLSYPYGARGRRERDCALDAGYRLSFTIRPEVTPLIPNRAEIGRILVDPTDWPVEFALKLRGAYSWLSFASDIKARLRFLHSSQSNRANEVRQK